VAGSIPARRAINFGGPIRQAQDDRFFLVPKYSGATENYRAPARLDEIAGCFAFAQNDSPAKSPYLLKHIHIHY
jgi:hypothetical protein